MRQVKGAGEKELRSEFWARASGSFRRLGESVQGPTRDCVLEHVQEMAAQHPLAEELSPPQVAVAAEEACALVLDGECSAAYLYLLSCPSSFLSL